MSRVQHGFSFEAGGEKNLGLFIVRAYMYMCILLLYIIQVVIVLPTMSFTFVSAWSHCFREKVRITGKWSQNI